MNNVDRYFLLGGMFVGALGGGVAALVGQSWAATISFVFSVLCFFLLKGH